MPKKILCHREKSHCPIARALDILGDKWTLIILRDMLVFEKKQFREFSASPEQIPTNVLSDRLKMLESREIVTKHAYQTNRYEYLLTEKGKELAPLLRELTAWGKKYETELTPAEFKNWVDEKRRG